MIYAGRKNVLSTAATLLDPVVADPESSGGLAIRNLGTVSVFIGAADVTSGTGWELAAGDQMVIDFAAYSDIYAIAATDTVSVQLLRTSA